jgi:hypothetical protein
MAERDSELEEIMRRLEQSGPADWVREMHAHFQEKGFYRPEDLRRILGDPTDRVELRPGGPIVVPGNKMQ